MVLTLLQHPRMPSYMHDIDVNSVLSGGTNSIARPSWHLTPIVSTHPALRLTSTNITYHPPKKSLSQQWQLWSWQGNCNFLQSFLPSAFSPLHSSGLSSAFSCQPTTYPTHTHAGKRKPPEKCDAPNPARPDVPHPHHQPKPPYTNPNPSSNKHPPYQTFLSLNQPIQPIPT